MAVGYTPPKGLAADGEQSTRAQLAAIGHAELAQAQPVAQAPVDYAVPGPPLFPGDRVAADVVVDRMGILMLIDPQDPKDIKRVHGLQDAIRVEQKSSRKYEVPNFDPVSQKKVRGALFALGNTIFWPITVCTAKGFLQLNHAYSVNHITAKKNAGSSVAVQFGGCDGKIPNCLPTSDRLEYAAWLIVRALKP